MDKVRSAVGMKPRPVGCRRQADFRCQRGQLLIRMVRDSLPEREIVNGSLRPAGGSDRFGGDVSCGRLPIFRARAGWRAIRPARARPAARQRRSHPQGSVGNFLATNAAAAAVRGITASGTARLARRDGPPRNRDRPSPTSIPCLPRRTFGDAVKVLIADDDLVSSVLESCRGL